VEALANEGEVKLFGKWATNDVDVKDISLADYIQVRSPVYLPHTAGRYASKQFRKAQMPIVERLVCALMMNGRNNGKSVAGARACPNEYLCADVRSLLTGSRWQSESSCTHSRLFTF
jgi:small subunit ribosomal protein S5e